MRVAEGGHDAPRDKIKSRYGRVMANLKRSLVELSNVMVYDNSDWVNPYHLVAKVEDGKVTTILTTPKWLKPLLPSR
jgi:predicted ABC-type ATPase